MRQLILPGDRARDKQCTLDDKTSRYLVRTLRHKVGNTIFALDEAGTRFKCEIASIEKGRVVVSLSPLDSKGSDADPCDAFSAEAFRSRSADMPKLVLAQAVPKGQKFDLIIRQAVETGVELIVPLLTRYCVVEERDARDKLAKLERRKKIVREALQQSGSTALTEIAQSVPIQDLVEQLASRGIRPENSLFLLFHEKPLARQSLHEYCSRRVDSIVLVIGAEGGFSEEETALLEQSGFNLVHIPGPIMRTETAALFAIAAVKAIFLEKTTWKLSR